jgi:oligopeptide transport system substrate-binding protein
VSSIRRSSRSSETNGSRPENIVTSGSFKLLAHKPYDELVVVKDPMNWDVANVKLDRIEFYPLDEATTMMNLYKSGRIDEPTTTRSRLRGSMRSASSRTSIF